jgi:hypothetical protein
LSSIAPPLGIAARHYHFKRAPIFLGLAFGNFRLTCPQALLTL